MVEVVRKEGDSGLESHDIKFRHNSGIMTQWLSARV